MLNIMNEYVNYTSKTIDKYMKYIFEKGYDKGIMDKYTQTYIEYRYGDYVENPNKQNVCKNINNELDKLTSSLVGEKDQKFLEIVEAFYKCMFDLDSLYVLEKQTKAIQEIAKLRKNLLGIENPDFAGSFTQMVREDIQKKKLFIDGLKSETFDIKCTRFNGNKDILKVNLTNNIKFPNLYSDIAIEKAAQRDVIDEDLTLIKYALTCKRVVEDIITYNFETKYLLNLPKSIVDKKSKLSRLMTIIDNEYVVDKIRIVINFDTFDRFRTYIFELMKRGFIFDIFLDDKFNYSSDNIEYLVTFEKIFMLKDKYYYKDMTKNGTIKGRIEIVDGVV